MVPDYKSSYVWISRVEGKRQNKIFLSDPSDIVRFVTKQGLMRPWTESQTLDSRCFQQSKGLLHGAKQESERQASDPLHLGLWVRDFFFKGGKTKAGTNHHLVTFLNHSFGSRDVLVYEAQTRWSMAWGSISSSCPGETTWVCMLMMLYIIAMLVH